MSDRPDEVLARHPNALQRVTIAQGFYAERLRPTADRTVKFVWYREDSGVPVCSAKSRRCRKCDHYYPLEEKKLTECPECGDPRFCRTGVIKPGDRCRMHGGGANKLVGSANPSFKHGKYSRYMPARLAAKYLESARDPELLANRQEIAVLDARLAELLGRVDTGESSRLFSQAREAFTGFRNALDRSDKETMQIHLQTLDATLGRAVGDYAAWDDIRQSLETRRKLVETEMRRLEKMQHFHTAEELQSLLTAIAHIAKRVISDPKVLNEFTLAILELGQRDPSRSPAADVLPRGA
ncbi:MAG TPA: hypothetical protein VIH05_08130 [Tepidiformaceae bacterium]